MGRFYKPFETTGITVGTSWTTLQTIELNRGQAGLCNIEIANVHASVALTALIIELQDHPSGTWYTFLEDADFASSSIWSLIFAGTSDDSLLYQLTKEEQAHIHLRLNAAYAMRIRAKTGSSGTVDIRGRIINSY